MFPLRRIKQIVFVFLWLMTGLPVWAAEYPTYIIDTHILSQDKGYRVEAHQNVTFYNASHQDLHEAYFYVYPNRRYTPREKFIYQAYASYFKVEPFPDGFPDTAVHIEHVLSRGKALAYQVEGEDQSLLKVDLGETIKPGQAVTLDISFQAEIPHAYGRFGWHNHILALSRWYPILAVHNDEGWQINSAYPFHRPFFSEASRYEVTLTAPKGMRLIHTGEMKAQQDVSPGQQRVTLATSNPVREFSMALSPDYLLYEQDHHGVMLKVFYLPGQEQRAKAIWQFAADMMVFYSERFGAYPYPSFSIAPVYLGHGGEQMSNMVFIDTRVYDVPGFLLRYVDFLISHETGHQWFYNLVGMDEFSEMWLEEGVNSFFGLEYLEHKYGPNANVVDYPSWLGQLEWLLPNFSFRRARDLRYQIIARQGKGQPVVSDLQSFDEPSSIFSLTYGKGSQVVAMLSHVMGEEAFMRAFKRMFNEYRYKNVSIKDFMALCEEESGLDLKDFLEQWLYGSEYFDPAVVSVQGPTITLREHGGITMPVHIIVEDDTGASHRLVWNARQKDTLNVSDVSRITRVVIDPDHQMLDLDRTNNHWPRNITVKVVPLYMGLNDMPLFNAEDSFNLVVGPALENNGIGLKTSFQKPFDYNIYAVNTYEFSEGIYHKRVGYELNNLWNTDTAFGAELKHRLDDDGTEDLTSGKVFLRKELSPAPYNIAGVADHVSLYAVRNQGLDGTRILGGAEDDRNISYLKRNEAIVGANIVLDHSVPKPDVKEGFKVSSFVEHAGHFWEATQFFYRAAVDTAYYQPLTPKSALAFRVKYGWGFPDDKNLFELGGSDGLRGYDRKTVRGANALLGSVEYRFPLMEETRWAFFDHMLGVKSLGGVVFFDGGQGWYASIHDSQFKQNAGIGLRAKVSIGAMFEDVLLRADVAQAIDDAREDNPRFWFGVNHAF